MKILFFSYAYPNVIDRGLATFNRTMITGLAKEHEVRVVSPVPFLGAWKARLKGLLPHGLNDPSFQAVPNVQAKYCTWYYTPKCLRDHYGTFMRYSVGRVLNRAMQEFQPDVVLSYWTHPDGEVAVKSAHEFGVKAVAMVGGSDVLLNARCGSRRETTLNVLHAADGLITVSDAIKQVLIEDGIPEEKLHVVRRGIDRDLFHRGDRQLARQKLGLPANLPILVSVGRLVDVKGHTHLIQACKLLADRGQDFRCYFLGDGPLRNSLKTQIENSGLAQKIELKGSQSSAQLADWYQAADLSVLASLSEGVPNVLLELMTCGTPFVASNVGGIPEIADAYQDRLVPASDPAALADAIAEQLAKPEQSVRRPRRFEPPSMRQAALKLSSVLQFVRTGNMAQPIGEKNIQVGLPVIDGQLSMLMPNKNRLRTFSPHAQIEDDDPLGRTGENFQYFPESTLNKD